MRVVGGQGGEVKGEVGRRAGFEVAEGDGKAGRGVAAEGVGEVDGVDRGDARDSEVGFPEEFAHVAAVGLGVGQVREQRFGADAHNRRFTLHWRG